MFAAADLKYARGRYQSEKDASSCKSRDIAPDGKQTVNVEICIFSNCPIPYRRGTDTQAHGISI
jgi:hypothetical protein